MKSRISLVAVAFVLAATSACEPREQNSGGVLDEVSADLSCPESAIKVREPWGKLGASVSCKIRHGPFVAVEANVVRLRGQFNHGARVGLWVWYDESGRMQNEVNYSSTDARAD
jgi:hypothetical protein